MTHTNKTRQRLMDSMRKAKNAEAGKPAETAESTPGSRKRAVPAGGKAKKTKEKQIDIPECAYSSGRRVWPD